MSTTTRITCKIPELSEWQFSRLTIKEKVGEELPTGTLSFLQDPKSEDLSIDSLTMDVLINDTYQLSMKAFVEEAKNYQGNNDWRLTFVPKEFYTDSHINEFKGIKSLIQSLSPYEVVNSPKVDCGLGSTKLYQNNITDFLCLIKYLKSLQQKQVYSFRCDGLYFTDLNDKPDPDKKINIEGFARYIPLTVRRNKLASLKATTHKLNTNSLVNVHYSNQVIAMGKDFATAYMNYLENNKIYKCLEDVISYDFPDYMNLRAGDLVKLTGSNYETNNYIVTENSLELTMGASKNKLTFSAI